MLRLDDKTNSPSLLPLIFFKKMYLNHIISNYFFYIYNKECKFVNLTNSLNLFPERRRLVPLEY